MYMMWYDDNPKVTQADKIAAAIEAYIKHFKTRPNLALVNPDEVVEVSAVRVRGVSYVRKNNIWVGWEAQ